MLMQIKVLLNRRGKSFPLDSLRYSLAILFCQIFVATNSFAMDMDLSGFLSIGAAKFDDDTVTYGSIGGKTDYDMDRVLGLQLDITAYEKVSATFQVLSRGYTSEDIDEYQPKFSWAYLTYDVTPGLRLRLGRLQMPRYLLSDFLDVGYAYLWARPPLDVYPLVLSPISNYDGINVFYTGKRGGYDISGEFYFGQFEKSVGGALVESDNLRGINLSIGNKLYSLHYGYMQSPMSMSVDALTSLVNGLRSYANVNEIFPQIGNELVVEDELYHYHSLGLSFEYEQWIVQEETILANIDHAYLTDFKASFLSFGYQTDLLTPYIVVGTSQSETSNKLGDLINESIELEPDVEPGLNGLRNFARLAILPDIKQNTLTFGVRTDPFENVAVKLEAQQIRPRDNTLGQLVGSHAEPHNVWLYSIVVDAIF